MYKLLIVDDEEIEREGMAELIPWLNYEIELIGIARDGVEGFEKIKNYEPDIVLTDIKMPHMSGLEMIRKAKEIYPDIEFVVLSGYGEYEFTSQAMKEGIKFYLLKPCSEEQIVGVIENVKEELQIKAEKSIKDRNMNKLLPRAREQVFSDMLLEREQLGRDYQLFLDGYGECSNVVVLAVRTESGFDYLEQFIFGNILRELLADKRVYLNTSINQDLLFLLDAKACEQLDQVIERTAIEFNKIIHKSVQEAVSEPGELKNVSKLYNQVMVLLQVGESDKYTGLLHYKLFEEIQRDTENLVNYAVIRNATDYGEVLFEIYLSFIKMELKKYAYHDKKEYCEWILKILFGKHTLDIGEGEDDWDLLVAVVDYIAKEKKIDFEHNKEAQRVKSILLAVFKRLQDREMSIQYLAREVLFMNEDYFGRIFVKYRKLKFSTFLLEQRINLAKRLLEYDPDLKIAVLAEVVGYNTDGQYFSKAFRKITNMSPIEYKNQLKEKSRTDYKI